MHFGPADDPVHLGRIQRGRNAPLPALSAAGESSFPSPQLWSFGWSRGRPPPPDRAVDTGTRREPIAAGTREACVCVCAWSASDQEDADSGHSRGGSDPGPILSPFLSFFVFPSPPILFVHFKYRSHISTARYYVIS